MEFLETDFKDNRPPSRRVSLYNKDGILTDIALAKYPKLPQYSLGLLSNNFQNNPFANIGKEDFTIKFPEEIIYQIRNIQNNSALFQETSPEQIILDFLKKQNIDFPEFNLATIGKTPHTVVWDKKKINAPMLIHIPLIEHKGYHNSWNPEASLWSNTFNFIYTEDNAKKLSGLSEYMFNEAHQAIERAIGEWLEEHATYTIPLSNEAIA